MFCVLWRIAFVFTEEILSYRVTSVTVLYYNDQLFLCSSCCWKDASYYGEHLCATAIFFVLHATNFVLCRTAFETGGRVPAFW